MHNIASLTEIDFTNDFKSITSPTELVNPSLFDLKAFFKRVLPAEGFYFYTYVTGMNDKGRKVFSNRIPVHNHEELIKGTKLHLNTDCYFCTASFKDGSTSTASNVALMKSFRADLDTGDVGHSDTNGYPNPEVAIENVKAFCAEMSIPVPGFVYSGHGLHAYWTLQTPITPDVWDNYAVGLKGAFSSWGLKTDETITSDKARILRVPGTFNYKVEPYVEVTIDKDFFQRPDIELEALDPLLKWTSARKSITRGVSAAEGFTGAADRDEKAIEYYTKMVMSIPNGENVPRSKWFQVMAGIYELWGDCEIGYDLALKWSKQSPKFTGQTSFPQAWEGFGKYRESHLDKLIGPGSLVFMAKEAGWKPAEEIDLEGCEEVTREKLWEQQAKFTFNNPKGNEGENNIKSTRDLQSREFADIKWIVPNFLAEGLTILGGRPKIGKSWLILDLCIAVAAGGSALGRYCEPRDVLYLALEDNDRRIQDRLEKILGRDQTSWPDIKYVTSWKGGVEELDKYLEANPNINFIVIDVFARFRRPRPPKINPYDWDYQEMAAIQNVASKYSVSICVVHHTRKGVAGDPGDEISGTRGLTGAADAWLILKHGKDGTIVIEGEGRDTPPVDATVEFDTETCRWKINENGEEIPMSEPRRKIYDCFKKGEELTPSDIEKKTGLSTKVVTARLRGLMVDGYIQKVARGKYKSTRVAPNPGTPKSKNPFEVFTQNMNQFAMCPN